MKKNARDQIYGIKQISELLQLPKSTLRYWESQGLIHSNRNPENGYREFSFDFLMEISDIAFFRGLDIPVKDLRGLGRMTIEDLREALVPVVREIDDEITRLRATKEAIELRLKQLSEIERLSRAEYGKGVPDFSQAVRVDYGNRAHWRHYLKNPERIVLWAHSSQPAEIVHGLADIPATAQDQVLWSVSKRATRGAKRARYLECLVRIGVDNPGDNNIPEHVKYISAQNRRPGSIVARYLGSSFDRKPWENYKAWIEVE